MDTEILLAAVKLIIMLPLVTALAYFLIKYGLSRKSFLPGGKRRMRLVEQIPIGPKALISLVEVGGRYILLAHSDSGFQVIRDMDELPEPIAQPDREPADWKGLMDSLKKTVGIRK
ncbi:MAG: flagellar biosynthetic protein FliO [Peptococcaceae bacterium]|nr:flagellar biosynthetic protein FliO [Peptococcaceae bacterium]